MDEFEVVDRTGMEIDSMKKSLQAMLGNLTQALQDAVKNGKVDEEELKKLLGEIDNQIINNSEIKNLMLTGDEATKTRIKNIINGIQKTAKLTIEQFRDSSKGTTLSDDQYKKVMEIYDEKVTGSATVTRTKVLDEFRTKADSITFESTSTRLSTTETDLVQVTDKLNKITAVKALMKPGEKLEDTLKRLSEEAGKFALKGDNYYKKIEDISKPVDEGGYDYEGVASKIAIGNFMYKNNPENCKLVSEFLNNLVNLREGNPEIENILAELAKAGIKPGKDGKYQIKQAMPENLRKKLNDALNKKLMAKPIDFKKARENTANAYSEKIDAEITNMLSSEFMKLYPKEMKKWTEMLDKAIKEKNVSIKDDIWDEMKKFLDSHDIAVEILDVKDFEDEATLTTRKTELESKKQVLTKRAEGERFENVPNEVKKVKVMDIEIDSEENLMGLSEDDLKIASEDLYSKKKKEFAEKFNEMADPKLKKVGFFERIGYAISHRTLQPKKKILEERIEAWAKNQIGAAISHGNEEIARQQGARAYAYEKKFALTPEELKEFNTRQAELLAKHKKEQEKAILSPGTSITAEDAIKKAKEDTEAELGE